MLESPAKDAPLASSFGLIDVDRKLIPHHVACGVFVDAVAQAETVFFELGAEDALKARLITSTGRRHTKVASAVEVRVASVLREPTCTRTRRPAELAGFGAAEMACRHPSL